MRTTATRVHICERRASFSKEARNPEDSWFDRLTHQRSPELVEGRAFVPSWLPLLAVPQRHQRIDFGRSPRRDVAGGERHDEQDRRDPGEHQWIVRGHAEQQRL